MKTLLLALLFIPTLAWSQDTLLASIFPIEEGIITYDTVVTNEAVSKDELFQKAKQWATKTFSSQKSALQSEDINAGHLLYRAVLRLPFLYPDAKTGKPGASENYDYQFNVKVYVKDQKAKILINDILLAGIRDGKLVNLADFMNQFNGHLEILKQQVNKKKFHADYIANHYVQLKYNLMSADVVFQELIQSFVRELQTKSEKDF